MTSKVRALGSDEALVAQEYGQKTALLSEAAKLGVAVPQAFALTGEQALRLLAEDGVLRAECESALAALDQKGGAPEGVAHVAVRASPLESLPGALLTRLSVPSDFESVLSALRDVVGSNGGSAAREQRIARKLPLEAPALPVLFQRFVAPLEAGDFGAVVFTHDPDRGTRPLLGEYQPGLGAEHVVSGKRISLPLSLLPRASQVDRESCLAQRDPAAFAEIERLCERLDAHFGEPLELELVRSRGTLWLLQVRPLVLSARALVQVALDAIERDSPKFRVYAERLLATDLSGLIARELPPPPAEGEGDAMPCLRGLAASPGVATGVAVTSPARALERAERESVVLFRNHATPEEVAAFRCAQAVVTTSGGLTCHAAVIARGLAVPAIVGCADVRVDDPRGVVHLRHEVEQIVVREGDLVSVDAHRGLVYRGSREATPRIISPELRRLAQELRKLRPIALWAYGAPEVTLRTKEDACLDGIVVPLVPSAPSMSQHAELGSLAAALDELPKARGRECWIELPAAHAEALMSRVPAGWGVVVRGALEEIPLVALRKLARLTPLGVHLDSEPVQTHAPIALDLALLGPAVGPSDHLSGLAPRLLRWADSAWDSARLGHSRAGGLLCETARASEWMLRLALRPPGPGSVR